MLTLNFCSYIISLSKQKNVCIIKGEIIMVIKNWKKFLRAILIIIGVIIFINLLIPDKSFSHQEIEFKTVAVSNGDTLWTIAKDEQEENAYYEGKDIRDIVYNIKKVNNLKSSNLKVNQTLEIPTY